MTSSFVNTIRPLAVLAAFQSALLCPELSAADTPQESKNQALVMNWYREVVTFGHMELASKYMASNYVEHDPNVPGGLAGFVKHYGATPARPIQTQLPKAPIQAFTKGDYVTLVWERDDRDPNTSTPYKYITYDVVRVKGGKIQEHWDSLRVNP
jgi:predicted SnoaL-like aldol condensation-catalyzing enzyme